MFTIKKLIQPEKHLHLTLKKPLLKGQIYLKLIKPRMPDKSVNITKEDYLNYNKTISGKRKNAKKHVGRIRFFDISDIKESKNTG